MRLNLGCGRAQLPTTQDNPFTQHLVFLPESALDPDERWINVDRVKLEGVGEIVDLFAYPWVRSSNGNPWNDSSIDELWASHIIEHIPHDARYAPLASAMHRQQGGLDGWYAWFYEAWRILKPDGLLHIVTPLAFSKSGVSDPSHTRYILPSSFSYLVPNPDAPFDYQIAARFEQEGELRAKPSDEWFDRLSKGEVSEVTMSDLATKLNNVYEEIYICLRAIKDA